MVESPVKQNVVSGNHVPPRENTSWENPAGNMDSTTLIPHSEAAPECSKPPPARAMCNNTGKDDKEQSAKG